MRTPSCGPAGGILRIPLLSQQERPGLCRTGTQPPSVGMAQHVQTQQRRPASTRSRKGPHHTQLWLHLNGRAASWESEHLDLQRPRTSSSAKAAVRWRPKGWATTAT